MQPVKGDETPQNKQGRILLTPYRHWVLSRGALKRGVGGGRSLVVSYLQEISQVEG